MSAAAVQALALLNPPNPLHCPSGQSILEWPMWARARQANANLAGRYNNKERMDAVMKTFAQFREQAVFLRESSGSTNIEKTLLRALKVLKLFHIPHYVCGGFAVQEWGYPRFTVDVDIIVPDVAFAIEKLSMNGFRQNPGSKMTVTDRETKVEVDLLPGGKKLDPGPLALPMPTLVSDEPQVLTLERLISAKLSTYMGRGIERVKDYADVVELVKANHPPRGLKVDRRVRDEYHKIWDGLFEKKV
jgi:hypothetical protein